ncbi:Na(+)/H(+) antiporter NhaA [Aureimonas endophytica]|uniref:Na(+)/H(+) antiporter NhaA n=1 Tax=Aureimonas endophytica TaxID=2027858 RepID=A0A917E9F7_9HYPH|nr:Na+/H+ antiporter NhaA [Aureimonas endophytica]GGE12357.1 Na(+)/H(+) antiporter NhaA [Aureimonas endophytica]
MSADQTPARSPNRPLSVLRSLLDNAAAGGIVLMAAAALALLVANSPLAGTYAKALHREIGGLSLLHWINDGLMALFFLMVGLEIKREMLDGQLATWSRRILPGAAALGGMIGPSLVYLAVNAGEGGQPRGWAIPAATDIAFALGVLALLGNRVPLSLRVFLTALAIIDDLGAVLVIAFFYTGSLDAPALVGAALAVAALAALNRLGVLRLTPYLLLGALLWVLVLKSGIHATLAGVVLALVIPLRARPGRPDDRRSPLHILEHALQPVVTFLIVPLFGFANAGVAFGGLSFAALADPVPLGAALGLFLGKQLGVFLTAAAVIRAGWADLPAHADWRQLYGVALLCGIGFTMSLFIGLLAFPTDAALQDEVKIGVLLGSVLSALAGAALFRFAPAPPRGDR